MVERVQVAMQTLESIKAPMSQREVAKLVGLTLGSLHRYPRVRTIFEKWSKDHHRFPKRRNEAARDVAEKQSEELIERVHAAIRELVDLGEIISQRSVCGILGISIWKLHRYPHVRTVVNQYATEYRLRECQQLEDQLLERVQISIRVFKSEGRFVSKRVVLKAAGVSHHLLHRYPRISALLDESFKGGRLNKLIRRERRLWANGIVPFAMKGLSEQMKSSKFFIRDFPSRGIGMTILESSDC